MMDESSGETSKSLIGHSGPVYGLSFNPDKSLLLSCSEDGVVSQQHSAPLSGVQWYCAGAAVVPADLDLPGLLQGPHVPGVGLHLLPERLLLRLLRP